VNGGKPVY